MDYTGLDEAVTTVAIRGLMAKSGSNEFWKVMRIKLYLMLQMQGIEPSYDDISVGR